MSMEGDSTEMRNEIVEGLYEAYLEVDIIKSLDNPDERYYTFNKSKAAQSDLIEFYKTMRHLHRHFLNDLPIVLVSYTEDETDAPSAFMCRHAWRAHDESMLKVLSNLSSGLIMINEHAANVLLHKDVSPSEWFSLYDIDFEQFDQLYESENVTLFFIDFKKAIDWKENEL